MFNLTRQEQQMILFLAASLVVGGVVSVYKQYRSDFAPDLVTARWLRGASPAVALADTASGVRPPSRLGTARHAAARDSVPPVPHRPNDRRSGKAALPAASLNLNTASAAQLQTLPGIGPKLAERIVAYRRQKGPFQKIEQLMKVKGIGRSKFAKLQPWVRVGP